VAALVAVLVTGCSSGSSPFDPRARARAGARLEKVEGCGDLLARLRAGAVADLDAAIDSNLEAALGWRSVPFGLPGVLVPTGVPAPAPTAPAAGDAAAGAPVFSGTNVQVAGVDEPDFVKTDGEYVYVAADGRLQILDARPAAETRRVSSTPIEGTPRRLLLHGDRVVVFSSLSAPPAPVPGPGPLPMPLLPLGGGECSYGYDCVPQGDGSPAKVTVLDVADRAAPRVLREITSSSSFLAARRIDGAVHLATSIAERLPAGVATWPESLPGDERGIRAAFEALRARNRALVEAADLGAWLPVVRDVRHGPGGDVVDDGLLASCEGFHASAEGRGASLLSVVSFPTSGDGELRATTVVGRPGFVYASQNALYVAAPVGEAWAWAEPEEETTAIHAFSLASGPAPGSSYAGSAAVDGHVLSSFSLDEHAGHLRVATTIGHLAGPRLQNAVTVLRADGDLAPVGRVGGLAPGEDIRAVRFDGARGFVVTFRKTDPLFVLDLADPAAPRVAGELKVPGFSTYMQLMDPGHLLTIGYDAVEDGGFAWFQGILLQIFDVRDPAAPALLHREVIGTRGSSSAAATNHLAFNWFAPKGLLAIPMTRCEGGAPDGLFSDRMTFSGLMVYDVSTAGGFAYRGGVEHRAPEPPGTWGACGSWWTQSRSLVERSIFLDEFVLSFTPAELRVQGLGALGTDLARVDFTTP
jgi:hypothetical protein